MPRSRTAAGHVEPLLATRRHALDPGLLGSWVVLGENGLPFVTQGGHDQGWGPDEQRP